MKNRVNKQIIKALSVGLAASMALQPVTVFAEDVNPGEEKNEQDPVEAAFDDAKTETQEASDALVTTDENKNLETQTVDGTQTQVHIPSAEVATNAEKDVVSGVASDINHQLAQKDKVNTNGYDTAISLIDGKDENGNNIKNKDGDNTGADADVQDALHAIDAAKTANDQIKSSLEASQDLEDSLDKGVTATPEKDGVKEAHQVNVDEYGVKADKEKDVEATGSIKDSNNAEAGFVSAGEKAGEAAGQFDNVTNSASDYANSGAAADITGTVLSGIKIDAETAGKTLEDAGKLLEQAEKDLASAQEKKDDADIAYADAENELKDATKALKVVLGLDPDSNDEIPDELLNTKNADGTDELGASAKKIELAKAALVAASTKLEAAKTERYNAKKAVEDAVSSLYSARYKELVELQDAIQAANDSEELEGEAKQKAINDAKENFKMALIKYYYFSELGEDESVTFAEAGFNLSELTETIKTDTINGVDCYFAGYDADNDYAEVWRPISELGNTLVAVKTNADGTKVQKRYSVTEENGVYTIVDITEYAKPVAEDTATIPSKYVIKDKDGNVTETKLATELEDNANLIKKIETDEAGKTTGIHVADTVKHKYDTVTFTGRVVDASALATLNGQLEDRVYVKKNENPIVDVEYTSDSLPTGKYLTEKQESSETFNSKNGGINAALTEYENLLKSENSAIVKDSIQLKYKIGKSRWFTANDIFDVPGLILSGAIDEIVSFFGGEKSNFKVEYKETHVVDVPTDTPEFKDFTGLLVETKDEYDEYVWTQTSEGKEADTLDENRTCYSRDGLITMPAEANETARTNTINSLKGQIAEIYADEYDVDASDLDVTVEENLGYWVSGSWKNPVYHYYYWYSYTVKTKAVAPTYGWELQKNTVNSTTSKFMYNSKDYSYVAPEEKTLSAYYNLGYENVNGTSKPLNDGTDQSSYDKQRTYNNAKAAWDAAQATFNATDEAFNKAKKELEEAQAALDSFAQLELAGRTKKEYVDKYNTAKAAFDVASANKKDAEDALNAAKDAKDAAKKEFDKADAAKKAADDAVNKADAAKKAADDARNATTGGGDDTTTGGGDDTTTGGGDDTTTFIPVAVTPATNVVAPAADNAQAPAVLGARTTRRTAAKSAADTDTVATDNSNGNGGNDNSAVAGAQKEETKTPEAPKEETKIEDSDTALAATPELEEKGFAWWWLLILAAIAGVSVEEYARRKSNKAKAEAKDSTKINK